MDTTEPDKGTTALEQYVAFEGCRLIARGGMLEIALAVYQAHKNRASGPIFALNAVTSELAEPDLRGGEDGIRARYANTPEPESSEKPSRGRPKLGVTAREITLLPRHWEWLETNPSGASAKLRALVEAAMRASGDKDRKNRAIAAVERFTNALAGDLLNAEEVSRAFYAGRIDDVQKLTEDWPVDVRDHYRELAMRAL